MGSRRTSRRAIAAGILTPSGERVQSTQQTTVIQQPPPRITFSSGGGGSRSVTPSKSTPPSPPPTTSQIVHDQIIKDFQEQQKIPSLSVADKIKYGVVFPTKDRATSTIQKVQDVAYNIGNIIPSVKRKREEEAIREANIRQMALMERKRARVRGEVVSDIFQKQLLAKEKEERDKYLTRADDLRAQAAHASTDKTLSDIEDLNIVAYQDYVTAVRGHQKDIDHKTIEASLLLKQDDSRRADEFNIKAQEMLKPPLSKYQIFQEKVRQKINLPKSKELLGEYTRGSTPLDLIPSKGLKDFGERQSQFFYGVKAGAWDYVEEKPVTLAATLTTAGVIGAGLTTAGIIIPKAVTGAGVFVSGASVGYQVGMADSPMDAGRIIGSVLPPAVATVGGFSAGAVAGGKIKGAISELKKTSFRLGVDYTEVQVSTGAKVPHLTQPYHVAKSQIITSPVKVYPVLKGGTVRGMGIRGVVVGDSFYQHQQLTLTHKGVAYRVYVDVGMKGGGGIVKSPTGKVIGHFSIPAHKPVTLEFSPPTKKLLWSESGKGYFKELSGIRFEGAGTKFHPSKSMHKSTEINLRSAGFKTTEGAGSLKKDITATLDLRTGEVLSPHITYTIQGVKLSADLKSVSLDKVSFNFKPTLGDPYKLDFSMHVPSKVVIGTTTKIRTVGDIQVKETIKAPFDDKQAQLLLGRIGDISIVQPPTTKLKPPTSPIQTISEPKVGVSTPTRFFDLSFTAAKASKIILTQAPKTTPIVAIAQKQALERKTSLIHSGDLLHSQVRMSDISSIYIPVQDVGVGVGQLHRPDVRTHSTIYTSQSSIMDTPLHTLPPITTSPPPPTPPSPPTHIPIRGFKIPSAYQQLKIKTQIKKTKQEQIKKYIPSLTAAIFKTKGKKPKRITGLEVRPIIK